MGGCDIEVGIMTSRGHKARPMKVLLHTFGIESRRIDIPNNAAEIESRSPRRIVGQKMVDFVGIAAGSLDWLARECHNCPGAVQVLDVLALLMPENSSDFTDAEEILTKVRTNKPRVAAAQFFTKVATQKILGDYHHIAYVPSASVAPVDRQRGEVQLKKAKSLWDDPLCLGLSRGLVEAMAGQDNIETLIAAGVLSDDIFMESSIVSTRMEKLVRQVGPLAAWRAGDGISMTASYRGQRWVIDAKSDARELTDLFTLVDAVAANATIGLAEQVATTVRGYVM